MRSPPRGSRTLHREVSLSPRPQMRSSHGQPNSERLPSIQDVGLVRCVDSARTDSAQILPDIPHQGNDRSLSELRTPLRHTPQGPSQSVDIPAHLSPPHITNRTRHSSDRNPLSQSRNNRQLENGNSRQTNYETPSPYRLPMHSGPPQSGYSPSSSPAPSSPYIDEPISRNGYHSTAPHSSFQSRQGESAGLPPPPPPYYNQYNTLNGHPTSYDTVRGYSNGDGCRDVYYNSSPVEKPPYHPSSSTYGSTSYSYHMTPSYNGNQYQNSYGWPVQFESEDVTSQVPKKRRGNLPRNITDMLKQWFEEHLAHPYPTEEEKQMLCARTGLAMTQVSGFARTLGQGADSGAQISNWFINSRRRRVPELEKQADAEKQLRERSGDTSSSSD